MANRRHLSEDQVVASIRKHSGAAAAQTASQLLAFAHDNNVLVRRRHASVSVRIALGLGERPVTLFVLPETDRFYTYWLDHWPRRYRAVASRYAAELRRIFPARRVISPQAARRNIVTLEHAAARMQAVQRAATRAILGIRAINSLGAGSLAESLVGLEGEARRRMIVHRRREGWLRDARIALVKNRTGRLACEVKGCGFDFGTTYGELGQNYAQVHHLRPLADRTAPSKTRVADLRVVCANCHAMIHLGGKSRSLGHISAALRAARRRFRRGAAPVLFKNSIG